VTDPTAKLGVTAFYADPKAQNPSYHNPRPERIKTSLCRDWREKGACDKGNRCWFAHGADELRSIHDPLPEIPSPPSPASLAPSGGQISKGAPWTQPAPVNHPLYKTSICPHFKRHGTCWYADKCRDAHGKGELRPMPA
jgi:hypothetical protein